MKRDYSLDFLKGLGICLVVLGHIIPNDSILSNWIYSFHMPLFFVVTGYLSSSKEQVFKQCLYKNARSILYPYFVFSIIKVIATFINNPLDINEFYIIVINTITFAGDGIFWFLPTLFISKVLDNLISKNKYSNGVLFLVLVASFISCPYLDVHKCYRFATVYYWINIFNRCLPVLVFFRIGALYRQLFTKYHYILLQNKMVICSLIILVLSVFIVQVNGHVDLHYSKVNNPIMYYLFAITIILAFFIIAKKNVTKNNLICYYGENSLSIMVTHTTLSIVAFVKYLVSSEFPDILYFGLVFVLVMLIETGMVEMINMHFPILIKYKN